MEFSTSNPLLQSIVENGVGGIVEAVWVLLNETMKLERENHLGAASYQRSKTRTGHANGYKPRTIRNKFGKIRLDVPQVRDGGFYSSAQWQRCQFHIQRNAVVRVARKSMRAEIHRDIRNVFSMPPWAQRSRDARAHRGEIQQGKAFRAGGLDGGEPAGGVHGLRHRGEGLRQEEAQDDEHGRISKQGVEKKDTSD